jgi:hypothetical protein
VHIVVVGIIIMNVLGFGLQVPSSITHNVLSIFFFGGLYPVFRAADAAVLVLKPILLVVLDFICYIICS